MAKANRTKKTVLETVTDVLETAANAVETIKEIKKATKIKTGVEVPEISLFPCRKVNNLKQAIIPANISVRATFYLDNETHVSASITALKAGLTLDEYIRRLIWANQYPDGNYNNP